MLVTTTLYCLLSVVVQYLCVLRDRSTEALLEADDSCTLSGVVRKRHLRDGAELNFEGIHLGREGGKDIQSGRTHIHKTMQA